MNSAWRALTPSSTSVVLMTSNTAPATAQASGLPPYVVPCTPTPKALAISVVVSIAPIGEAAAQSLRARQDVGNDALLHVREERAGAAHAALDLVQDQQRVVLVAQAARRLQELGRARRHPAFALHRLEDHGADVVAALLAKRGFQRRDVVVRNVREARRDSARSRVAYLAWPPAVTVNSVRPWNALSVEMTRNFCAPKRSLRVAPRELQRRFVGLGAGVAEEHALGERVVDETLREPQRRLVGHPVRHVPELLACSVERLTIAGWQCPSAVTATPLAKSMYMRPSWSQTREPSPRTGTKAAGA